MPEEAVLSNQRREEYEALFDELVHLPYHSSHVNMSPSPASSPSRKRSHDDMSQNIDVGQHNETGVTQLMSEVAIERPPSGETGIGQVMSTAELAGHENEYQSDTEPDVNFPNQDQPATYARDQGDNEAEAVDDPATPLDDYDWVQFEENYHDQIEQLNNEEKVIWEEFQDLCSFFAHWADTMQTYEVDRSFKRLKTQVTYVQRKEEDLEQKRSKYVQVVQALQSALELLK